MQFEATWVEHKGIKLSQISQRKEKMKEDLTCLLDREINQRDVQCQLMIINLEYQNTDLKKARCGEKDTQGNKQILGK